MKPVVIKGRKIGPGQAPFIIAEMSGNHNQSLARALEIVDAAADSGVDALKLQTYTADTMTINLSPGEFTINEEDSLWQGYSLYDLYQEAHTPWEWHEPILKRCQQRGIIGFSTPFDASAVEFLEELNVPCYKIASFENTDLPLIRKVAATGKPVIMSTGTATAAELAEAVDCARKAGATDLILLKCTSAYPAPPQDANIITIPHMQKLFDCPVGISDHTLGIGVAVASVALGAVAIEKHFTLNRAEGGVDAAFSLEPEEMKQLVSEACRAQQALGKVAYGPVGSEVKSVQVRRSLYVTEDMEKGDLFSPANIRAIRPGLGLPPKYLEVFLDKPVKKKVKKGTPVSWDLI